MKKRNFLPTRMSQAALALIIGLAANLEAKEDGERLFKQNCSACHGSNGEGAANGAFPALSKSRWIQGEPERAIQVLLHGLAGPISVHGKTYNLAMPPQGAMLKDADIAAVLSHVRQSFGNEESAVTSQQVTAARKWSAEREKPWSGAELLKHFPLPAAKSPIHHLLMEVYHGEWKSLPNFEEIERASFEEEQYGFISLRNVEKKNGFAVIWHGELEVEQQGVFTFWLDSNDGSRLWIDNKAIAEINSVGRMGRPKRRKKVTRKLKKGMHPIRLEYFDSGGAKGIALNWSGPGIPGQQWLSDEPSVKARPLPVIDLTPKGLDAVIYNNFIQGTTARALGVGYSEGQNVAFSTQNCGLELLWHGNFINAGRHWTARGQGAEGPMSSAVVDLSKSIPFRLSKQVLTEWSDQPVPAVQFKGYVLDKQRKPTFTYSVGNIKIIDSITASSSGITRELTVTSTKSQNLAFKLTEANAVVNGKSVRVGDTLSIESTADCVNSKAGTFTNLKLKQGTNKFTFIYSWN